MESFYPWLVFVHVLGAFTSSHSSRPAGCTWASSSCSRRPLATVVWFELREALTALYLLTH
jgi:hypothetical protein